MKVFDDTIVGISTSQSPGAISIIRVSGEKALEIVNQVFKGKDLTKVKSHTIHYGHIVDKTTNQIIDEVLVSVFLSPKSYTTEDLVEINCHGGLFVTNQIFELLVTLGARAAQAGEFTKRAFLAGRIDLTKAEAVMDVITAENKMALKMATNALNGKISSFILNKRQQLLDIIATISVNIDYPEYDDVIEITNNDILPAIIKIKSELQTTLFNSMSAKLLKNGINTVIVGRPNVGKSSLLNAILKENKAIVTNIPGTTRDIVESSIQLDQVTLNLIDTAGIRQTKDVVEQIGVEKSKEALDRADIVLFVLDGSTSYQKEDEEIFDIHASRRPARRLRRKRAGTAGDRRGQGAGRRRAADAADGREVQCARRPPAAHVGERRGRLVGFALVVQRLFPGRAVVRLRERPQPPGAGVRPDVHRTRRAGKTHHRQP